MPPTPANASRFVFQAVNLSLFLAFIWEVFNRGPSPTGDAATIALAAAASILALARQLPLQNVWLAAAIAGIVGGAAHGLSSDSALCLPFGPIHFNSAAGWQIFHLVPWTLPLVWIIAIFNARGVARLVLRPWRKVKNYGFWLIGVTSFLAVVFDTALEPFAVYAKHFWFWQRTKLSLTWQGAGLLNFAAWAFVAWLIMMLATPSLIPKQPKSPSAPDWHPLALWLGALTLFAIGTAHAGHGSAFAADAAIAALTAGFAIRGAQW